MSRQGGLGRGLASLIPQKKKIDTAQEVNFFGSGPYVDGVDAKQEQELAKKGQRAPQEKIAPQEQKADPSAQISVVEVPVQAISSNPFQPRKHFNEEKLQELAASIKIHGIIQPLVVTKQGEGQYELIAGERRLEASKIAGLEKVPVVLKEVSDQDKLELALIENIQRHNLNVIEEARSYKQLYDTFSLTQEEIARRVGKSRSAVTNTLRLLNLPIEIQKALQEGKITEGHARTILSVSNPEKQRALFELILKEQLSVRQIEERVKEISVSSHRRKLKETDPEIDQLEQQLSASLGTRVKIKKGSNGGQIAIEYFSHEEFDNLYNKLAKIE